MKGPIRILLVEDSEDDELLLTHTLREGGYEPEVVRVLDEGAFRNALEREDDWDIVICDYSLPTFSAPAALRIFHSEERDIPFIVVSGRVGEETAVETLKIGADDYLLKNNLRRLVPSVERALRESEVSRRCKENEWIAQRVFTHSRDVIAVLDSDCEMVQLSDAGMRILGVETDPITSTQLSDFVHPEDWEMASRNFKKSISEGGLSNFEFRVVNCVSGRVYFLQWSCNWSDEDGLLFAIARDVTELQKHKERQALLTDVLDTTPDLVIIFTPEGKPLFFNQAARDHFGLGVEDPTDINLASHFPGGHQQMFRENARASAIQSGYWSGETSLLDQAGNSVPMSQTLVAHKDRNNEVSCFSTIMRDIGPLRRLQEQALQSGKMEAVGQLAGGVAHDFNNLLTVISGYSSLLVDKAGMGSEDSDSLQTILEACDRAAGLTRQLLAFGRKEVISPENIEVNLAVKETTTMLRRLIGDDISLELDLVDEELFTFADASQFNQIIMNLCINSRDAMPTGGRIKIETGSQVALVRSDSNHSKRNTTSYQQQVVLTVSDSGSGIPDAAKAHIFEPFFTTKEVGRGTGLGLSVVHGIVEQNSGKITVRSESGAGTIIKICLPAVEKGNPSVDEPKESGTLHGNETVLLAEDEPHLRKLVEAILLKNGYHVHDAANGKEALKLADSIDSFDLLITDIVMPGMSGPKLAEEFAAIHPDTPTLFMSGYTDDEMVRYNILRDEINFIQKPFDPSDFLKKIRQVLDSHAGLTLPQYNGFQRVSVENAACENILSR